MAMAAGDLDFDVRRLNSPGPISDAFLRSRAFVAVLIGPVGSAKTLTGLRKLRRLLQQQKGKLDAEGRLWRRGRGGVIRESYPNIDKNILPSWFRIHPESDGKFGWRAPYSHSLRLIQEEDEDGNATDICDIEMEFRAIGDKSVEEVCRGWEINGALIDEADLQPADLLSFLSGRVGRFSDLDPSMVVDPQIILTLNAPYTDNWVYKIAIERELGELVDPALLEALGGRPLIEVFIQPGGLDPNAENLHNLPGATKENPKGGRSYYLIQAAVNKHRPGYVDRMIHNKFVPMQHGQPVYGGFNYSEHVSEEPLEWDPRRKLIVSLDQGLYAAAVFSYRTVIGQRRVLDEVVFVGEDGKTLDKLGPTSFGRAVKAKLTERWPDLRPQDVRVVCDPAAFAAKDRKDSEHDWVLAVQKELRLRIHKAKSNVEELRLEAVRRDQNERGGYLVDKRCRNLIRGHLGGYHYKKAEMAEGEMRGHLEIADTIHTHVCDADQYGALEGEHVIADIRGKGRAGERRVIRNESDYRILGG